MEPSPLAHAAANNMFLGHPPPLVNQPPQIFGAYTADGTPISASLAGQGYSDDMFLGDDGVDQGDSKRRRIARACDMCRKKKIKCDGKMPACSHCINYKTECVFTQVEKKRQPPKGAKYIEGLENRLKRMENLLRMSGMIPEDDVATDLGVLEDRLAEQAAANENGSSGHSERAMSDPKQTPAKSPQQGGLPSPSSGVASPEPPRSATRPSAPASTASAPTPAPAANTAPSTTGHQQPRAEEEVEALSDMMCSLVTNNCGETRYIGSSSGFSIFSPRGIQWVNEKTGDSSFQQMISTTTLDDHKWIHWKPEVFGDIFARRVFRQLPPKNEAISLLRDYFQNFNCIFPLYHEATFMHLVEREYSSQPYTGSGWWASLNVALAIAHRLRVMSNLVPQEEDDKAWGYLKNALAVLSELTLRNTDLLSVQALLGMALFLTGTPNPQPSFLLIAAAIRVAHSIGLHKRGSGFNLSAEEIEQRKRVFWIAYLVDRDLCLRSGRPPIQDDDDMNVELPSEDPLDNIGNIPLADGKGKVNLFRLLCTFAMIESKVYKRLYSVKATKQTDGELLNAIGELDRELEEWKDQIPVDFRPEQEIKASHSPLILHVVFLHFAYYNCLSTIHRMSVHHGYWTSRLSNYAIQGLNARPLNPRVFSSAALCVQAARASIHLLKYMPPGDSACAWMVLYFPVSALVTLFASILQNPLDTRTKSDVKLMGVVVGFLAALATDDANNNVKRMLSVCSEFERIAKLAIERGESSHRRKRKDPSTKEHQPKNQTPHHDPTTPDSHRTPHRSSIASAQQTPAPHTGDHHSVNSDPPFPFSPDFTHNSLQNPGWLANHFPNTAGLDIPPTSTTFAGLSAFDPLPQPPAPPLSRPSQQMNGGAPTPTGAADGMSMSDGLDSTPMMQDLWQMPMTLEWDWNDMAGFGGGFQTGMDMNGIINGGNNGM